MLNLFDRAQYPSREPATATIGGRWVWQRPDIAAVYAPADFALSYEFYSQADSSTVIDGVTAAEDADGYYVEMEQAKTDLFTAGDWAWSAIITRGSDSKTAEVDRGFLSVLADAGGSQTYQTLVAIRATIEGVATENQLRIEIAGRIIQQHSIEDLLRLEARYAARWRQEQQASKRRSGRRDSRTLIGLRA